MTSVGDDIGRHADYSLSASDLYISHADRINFRKIRQCP